ncbi:MAG: DNRLRE domain-containing protein [Candidatus Thorarchaeota archaeon]
MRYKVKEIFQWIFLIIFVLFLVIGFPVIAYYKGYNRTIQVDKDAYISEYNPDVNYGSDNYLRAGEYYFGKVHAYYHFNISSHSYNWEEAWIYVIFDYGTNFTDIGVNFTSNNWDEKAITWNNRPDSISYIGHILCDGFGFRIPVDLDQFVDDGVSVCLYGRQEGQGEYIQGYSKEGASDNDQIAWIQLSYIGWDPVSFEILLRIIIIFFSIMALIIVAIYLGVRGNRKHKAKNLPKRVVWNKPVNNAAKFAPKKVGPLPPPNIPEFLPRHYPKPTPTLEKEINKYITLKLEHGRTYIYVNGRRFLQCIRLILNIQKKDIPLYDEIESIDEAAQVYKNHLYQNRIVRGPMAAPVWDQSHDITPEQEFWAHCSNIQAWVENNYDTRILMSNISFPLLRALSRAGDPPARRVFKEEIALRLESGYPSVVQYLLVQGYINQFSQAEFESILESTGLIQKVSSNSRVLFQLLNTCTSKFPTLMEDILLKILKLPDGYNILISVIQKDTAYKHLPIFLQSHTKLIRFQFLGKLKVILEKMSNKADEKTRNQILGCIQAVNEILSTEDINNITPKRNYLDEEFQLFNNFALQQFIIDNFKAKINAIKKEVPSRCAFCGKIIPKGKDVCEWCGHKKDDDPKFPHPFIFKPPGGGGGSMKAVAVVKNKSAA